MNLCDEMGIEKSIVFSVASLLGKNEDFDGLITALQDLA